MIDEVPVPRSKTGQRMYHVARGYVVLVDARRDEVSERAYGDTHVVFNRRGRADIVFVPDEAGKIELEAVADSVGYEMRDRDGEFIWSHNHRVGKNGRILFDFDTELDRVMM